MQAFSGGTVIPPRQYSTSYSLTPSQLAARAELDATPLQCPVQACGEGAPEAVVPGTTLEMTEAFGMKTHHVTALSDICFYAIRYQFFRLRAAG
ncbi:hypothetical protein PQQ81_30300 [Paraburkholderia strydomiana]|uniref:hypothetical protein n=1 Tax=Paraburkholderia strydomiana TaxID=1245417 RepID=UPI0038BA2CFA